MYISDKVDKVFFSLGGGHKGNISEVCKGAVQKGRSGCHQFHYIGIVSEGSYTLVLANTWHLPQP